MNLYICSIAELAKNLLIHKKMIMRKLTQFTLLAAFLVIAVAIITGCKKDKDDPVPAFSITYDTVSLIAGGKGVQFFAKCTNNDVKMSQATITNPASGFYIRQFSGASFGKDASIPLQETNTAYPIQTGTWKINLTGNSGGGTAFTYDGTIAVTQ